LFPSDVQQLLNVLVFFIIWPAINVVGNSITFYLFIGLCFRVGSFWLKPGFGKKLFLLFGVITILSSILAPYNSMPRHLGFASTITIGLQWMYWILLSIFIIVNRNRLNYIEMAKWVFFGIIAASIGFYLFKFRADLGPLQLRTNLSRNAFVFTLLTSIPVSFYYLKFYLDKSKIPIAMIAFLFIMLFTNGRSGGVIIFLELILIASVVYGGFQKSARILFVIGGFLFFLNETEVLEPIKEVVANNVATINPRLASLIRSEEGDTDGDLSMDKSWLLRLLMIQKGGEIVHDYPILGIGANNFAYYDANLKDFLSIERLSNRDKEFFNSRSSHNSYIQILSEFGFVGFGFIIIILAIPIIVFVRKFFVSTLEVHDLFSISIVGAAFHFYAINTITGAIAWMFIGLAWVCLSYQQVRWLNLTR
jgi:O-antigen ligase